MVMKIGYARGDSSPEETQTELATFESLGCERIVVDNGSTAKPGAALNGLLARLGSGDTLIVWSLGSVADSLAELVSLTLDLEARGVRLQSLMEEFDTDGDSRQVSMATLRQLKLFQDALSRRQNLSFRRRPGRPKALSDHEVERARGLIAGGATIEEAAHELRVSRATLYRYLYPSHA